VDKSFKRFYNTSDNNKFIMLLMSTSLKKRGGDHIFTKLYSQNNVLKKY